jgi:hypothetical protein
VFTIVDLAPALPGTVGRDPDITLPLVMMLSDNARRETG